MYIVVAISRYFIISAHSGTVDLVVPRRAVSVGWLAVCLSVCSRTVHQPATLNYYQP